MVCRQIVWANLCLCGSVLGDPMVVQTSSGPVKGAARGAGKAWLGVPFAADTSIKRFAAPVAPTPWTAVRDATEFGPGCVQTIPYVNPGSGSPKVQSEDCLNVNVYAPASWTPSGSLPVYVFIYGGAFVEGGNNATRDLYEADELANSQNIIVFVPNYRLEAFGFLVLPGTDVLGNFGIMDQQFALKWVRQNAASFGADPNRITVGGQSAGGMSTGIHMSIPSSRGLFHQAIMHSNVAGFQYKDVKAQATIANSFIQETSCPYSTTSYDATLKCLRGLSTSQIKTATASATSSVYNLYHSVVQQWGHILDIALPWTPTVGTDFFPTQVQDAFSQGTAAYVPLLFGTVQEEGWTFVAEAFGSYMSWLTGLEYPLVVDVFFADDATAVKDHYPHVSIFDNACAQLGEILTDYWFKCASQKIALANVKAGKPTWSYRHVHPMNQKEGQAYSPALPIKCVNHTCHTSDIPVWMGSIKYSGVEISEQEKAMRSRHMDYIGSFINGRAPFTNADPTAWPQFDEDRKDLVIGDKIFVESQKNVCEFWDSIGYPRSAPPSGDSDSIYV